MQLAKSRDSVSPQDHDVADAALVNTIHEGQLGEPDEHVATHHGPRCAQVDGRADALSRCERRPLRDLSRRLGRHEDRRELVIAEDLSRHPYWKNYQALALHAGLRACWSLPFKDDSGQVLGTFGIYYPQPTRPSAADIALVTEFTRLAGLAVQFSATTVS